MTMRSFGDLSGHFKEPARGGNPSSFIMILHGWGADGADLADLAMPIAMRFPGAAFFIPDAPDPCTMNPAGRQWFDIDDRVNGPVLAAPCIETALAAARDAFDLPASATALTGFSQGGMMALHCGLHMDNAPAAIVSFSGALLVHDKIQAADDQTTHPEVLLVHGREDAVVPFALMAASAGILEGKDISVQTAARSGVGHGIDPDGLTIAIDFLATQLPQ
ncbi:hypothetical protein N9368_02325 [Alphaproteobacteria bacterium]|nr:hypothetical protein [Alphaproteobacteria bacterium]